MNASQPGERGATVAVSVIESISAVTLATHDMARAVRFYRALGFTVHHGGEVAAFTSLAAGSGSLNLIAQAAERAWSWWGRVIFHVADVDAFHLTCPLPTVPS